ncbi:MAG: class I SAM-dependent methyltransferase [Puniceicoccaceae bacterium]
MNSITQRIRRRFRIYPKYWLKTRLYANWPGGWGYYGMLRGLKEEDYVHDRDKHPVRHKHHGGGGWKEELQEGDFNYRDYSDYEEYLDHQKAKFDELIKSGKGFTNEVVLDYRRKFFRRFKHLPYYLPKDAKILCAGARQGTEVEVLHDLGYRNAYGIDLNPGPNNRWVVEGDFMKIDAPDHSLDMVYCNAIDHAFNMEGFFEEQLRVLKPGGYAIYESIPGMEGEVFESVEWRSDAALFRKMLDYFSEVIRVEREDYWMWFLLRTAPLDPKCS